MPLNRLAAPAVGTMLDETGLGSLAQAQRSASATATARTIQHRLPKALLCIAMLLLIRCAVLLLNGLSSLAISEAEQVHGASSLGIGMY
jgi:hypothetical protein